MRCQLNCEEISNQRISSCILLNFYHGRQINKSRDAEKYIEIWANLANGESFMWSLKTLYTDKLRPVHFSH